MMRFAHTPTCHGTLAASMTWPGLQTDPIRDVSSLLTRFVMLALLVSAVPAAKAQEDTNPLGTGIDIKDPVLFIGEAEPTAAGSYFVSISDWNSIRLAGQDGVEEIDAVVSRHNEEIEAPVAFTDKTDGNEFHVVLVLPGGTQLNAIGSVSGVSTRGSQRSRIVESYTRQFLSSADAQRVQTQLAREGRSTVRTYGVYSGRRPSQDCNPGSFEVAFYEHDAYRGDCSRRGVGNWPTAALLGVQQDSVSSIQLGSSSVQVCVYRNSNFGGRAERITASDANLRDNHVGTDQISSARIQKRGAKCP